MQMAHHSPILIFPTANTFVVLFFSAVFLPWVLLAFSPFIHEFGGFVFGRRWLRHDKLVYRGKADFLTYIVRALDDRMATDV